KDRSVVGKHMHIDELTKLLSKMNNEHILITHITQRTAIHQARKMLKKNLPEDIHKKIILFMDNQ
ncbi:MAG: hypothetical protein WCZ89_09825, partial [Phycisphaerae bacterium]